jgi:Tol biopolymer transport system component
MRSLQTMQMLLVSRRMSGAPANAMQEISISSNGRYVAYASFANDIVPGDTNGQADIFLFDRTTSTTTRASLDSVGAQANGNCYRPALSQTGRFVVFESPAANFGAPNTIWQIFLKDLQTGALTLCSRDSAGVIANGNSSLAHVSGDGRYVAFVTDATNLFPGDLNGLADIVVRDVVAGVTELASANSAGAHGDLSAYSPDMSADGRCVVFHSNSTNLTPLFNSNAQIYLRDRLTATTEVVSVNSHGFLGYSGSTYAAISGDGRFVSFASDASNLVAGDGNGQTDVFLRDRRTSAPWTYGVGQTNSQGCRPSIVWSGSPSASAGSGFLIECGNELNQKIGLLFYSTHGAATLPYLGGFLYVRSPSARTARQNSGGSASGSDCTGHFSYDFDVLIASHVDPSLVAGADVWAQYWSRDPGSSSTTSLSDAIVFVIGP